MDDLRYEYDGGHLQSVQDLGVAHASVRNDFSEGSTGIPSPLYPEYLYDANGNMIEDKNKAIVITYNYLNLPSKVEYEDGRTIEYVYGTDGTKRRMTVKDPSVSLETNTDYLNAVVYEDGVIDYLMMDEGLVKNESGEYRYHYYLQDHLGNTRAVFKNDGGNVATLIQANAYYPFGLEIPELSYVSGSGETKYKYNGKEMQDAFSLNWIDYGARFYDPQIGRWHVVDQLASEPEQVDKSPYAYAWNNPINLIDADGNYPGPGIGYSSPMNAMAEGFRQYFQAAGSIVDKAFVSMSETVSTMITKSENNIGIGSSTITTSVDVVNTTTIRPNLSGFMETHGMNVPSERIFSVKNKTDIYQNTKTEVKGIIEGADVKGVKTIGTSMLDGNGRVTTEVSAGKGSNGIYVSNKQESKSSQTDIGIKTGYQKHTQNTTTTIFFKAGVTIYENNNK